MKPNAIATTIISALLLGGVLTACNQASPLENTQTSSAPVAATTSQASSAPTATPSDTPQANNSTTPERDKEREQRREARRKQIEAVLTPDQVQQLQAKMKNGDKLRNAISSLNLTADQKNKIQIIMEKSYDQNPNSLPNKSSQ